MRIRALTLLTRDVAAQAALWGDALGVATAATGDALTIRLHGSLIRFDPAPAGLDTGYHFAINIPRGRIEDAADWIARRHDVLAFHGDPDVEEGATIVHTDRGAAALSFLDGCGDIVELIANSRLENGSDAPFGPAPLLEIAAPVGRGWIPTGLPAVPLPTTIVADGPEARELVLREGPYQIRTCRPAAGRSSAFVPEYGTK